MRVRKDVWKLPSTDRTLYWYGVAVAEMKARQIAQPNSWRFQAAMHGYDPTRDPFRTPGETLPAPAVQKASWSQCQHGSWYFLAWHRGYLFYFERILLDIIQKYGGPADWALPYWNYSDPTNPNALCLPVAFRSPSLKNGTNPLYVQERASAANAGTPIGTLSVDADITSCLGKSDFTNSATGGATGFGGGRSRLDHRGPVAGECERTPHGSMHDAIGGATGWMEFFETAALDPIFWLHHSNIDRLWEVWRLMDPSHTDPTLAAWINAQPFSYFDENNAVATLAISQMVDTTKPVLDYTYEDMSNPLGPAPIPTGTLLAAQRPQVATATERLFSMSRILPEMVGASTEPQGVTLGAESREVRIPLREPTGPALRTMQILETTVPQHVYLNLENITAQERPIHSYEIYVDVPDGDRPSQHPELMAGLLPRFGLLEASRRTAEHAGDGLNYSIDITRIVEVLRERDAWDASGVRVAFVPHNVESSFSSDSAPNAAPVRVGRVSVYYE